MTLNDMYDYLVDHGIATEEEVELVTCINGYNEETMESILYARTGYHSFYQLEDEDDN